MPKCKLSSLHLHWGKVGDIAALQQACKAVHQAPVVCKVDIAIHGINLYLGDRAIYFLNTLMDSFICPLNNWAQLSVVSPIPGDQVV